MLVGSYRQLVTYRGDRIERLEEFHDAAKMIAFWQMISGETEIEKALLAQPSLLPIARHLLTECAETHHPG